MTSYAALKLAHMLCVYVSGALFAFRFMLLNRRPHDPLPRLLKIVPHLIDTVLLGAAIAMLVLTGVNPFQVDWLTSKIVALFVYIGFGAVCLRAIPGSRRQIAMFAIAASTYFYIVWVALSKRPIPLNL